eukprot:Tbor_TRINITY_DN6012_c0_g1::TRINITY_DN6012_c0_g1_i2::g.10198::m.10198/K20300/TRAPPC1, BET5; trafficking protein particle complex subunit 1
MIYTFYIFNRYADCIFYRNWGRLSPEEEGESNLVAGLIYSLKIVMKQLSYDGNAGYKALSTSYYKLHFLETPTGYRFALTTSPDMSASFGQSLLEEIFRTLFVEFVVKDILYTHQKGAAIMSPKFGAELSQLLKDKRILYE